MGRSGFGRVVAAAVAAALWFLAPAAGAVGSLTISTPASASLPSITVAPGSSTAGNLGVTTVSDTRVGLLGWSVTVLAQSSLDDGAGHTIALPAGTSPLTWATGAVSAQAPATLLNVAAGASGRVTTTTPLVVAAALVGFGGGVYSYNPQLTFVVPANTHVGTYHVTLVQTVS
jgi:hypothetical protein